MSSICIFSAQYLPHMGGVENYTANLARYLVRKGDKVVIVTSSGENLPSVETMDDVLVIRMPSINFMNGRYPVLKYNKECRRLSRKLKGISLDLVLVNTRFYPLSLFGAHFAHKTGTRCIMIEHGTSHMTVHSTVGDFLEQIVEHTITFLDKRFCREFYGVSDACGEWLRHFHITASGTLYNAIDLEKIEMIKQKSLRKFREEYHIPDHAVLISFTGRLIKEKGIYQLIDSVNILRREFKDLYLILAGDGDELENVRKMTDDHIIAVGRLDFGDVIGLLETSDIFCLPSDSEGFPTSVLEAAACRCFVVTTEKGGAKEMINDRKYGIILKDNQTETVTKGLREAVADPEQREIVAGNTYQRLKENYTWEIVAGKVHSLSEQ